MTTGVPEETRHTIRQRSVLIVLAASAGAMPSLQPLLLGGMLDQHHISVAQIGQAASAEALGMAASATLASSFYRTARLGPAISIALILLAAANFATAHCEGMTIVILRAVAGFGGGILLWALLSMVTHEPKPARTFAIYVSVQAAWGFLLSSLIFQAITPWVGPSGVYTVLAAFNLALFGTLGLVSRLKSAPRPKGHRWPTVAGMIGLTGVGLFLCGIMAFWSYAVPLLREMTHSGMAAGVAIPMIIGVHILGGLVAASSDRFPPTLVCVFGPLLLIACTAAIFLFDSIVIQHGLLLIFAFIWMFVPPFQLPFLLSIDPSARTAMYISTSHLVGIATGPFLASMTVSENSAMGALGVALICLAGAAGLPLVARYLTR